MKAFYNITVGTMLLLTVALNYAIASEATTSLLTSAFTVELKTTPVSCHGLNDGSIEIKMTGAKPFNISITKGCTLKSSGEPITPASQTALFTDLEAGNYRITVTDKNGSSFSECISIGEPEPLAAKIEVLNPASCSGMNDGKVELIVSGGKPPYKTEPKVDLNKLAPGTYRIQISDSGNCGPVNVEFTIEENPAINLEVLTLEQLLCPCDETGSIEVIATGGNGNFTYNIDGKESNQTGKFIDLLPGNYTIVAIDGLGCSASMEITINNIDPLEVDIDASRVSSEYAKDGAIIGIVSGGTAPYNVYLYLGCNGEKSAFASGYDNSMVVLYWGLPGDFYTLKVVDSNGCQWNECIDLNFALPFHDITEEIINTDGEKADQEITLSNYYQDENKGQFRLYPNPFRSSLNIELDIVANTRVSVEIFNLIGIRVANLFDDVVTTNGVQKMVFTPNDLANGIYLCKVTTGSESRTERIVLKR